MPLRAVRPGPRVLGTPREPSGAIRKINTQITQDTQAQKYFHVSLPSYLYVCVCMHERVIANCVTLCLLIFLLHDGVFLLTVCVYTSARLCASLRVSSCICVGITAFLFVCFCTRVRLSVCPFWSVYSCEVVVASEL